IMSELGKLGVYRVIKGDLKYYIVSMNEKTGELHLRTSKYSVDSTSDATINIKDLIWGWPMDFAWSRERDYLKETDAKWIVEYCAPKAGLINVTGVEPFIDPRKGFCA